MSTTTATDRGRHYLLARQGKEPWAKNIPGYPMMTAAEADEAARELRARYGTRYEIRDMECPPMCEHDHPYNGSACELLYGHDGPCGYLETRWMRWMPWNGATGEELPRIQLPTCKEARDAC